MPDHEWSRSRHWFCHFLHNRHERLSIQWERGAAGPGKLNPAANPWLVDLCRRHRAVERFLLRSTGARYDPAYLQCLRLLVREQQYHNRLIERWMNLSGQAAPRGTGHLTLAAGRVFGPRWCLSVLLLDDLLDASLCRLLRDDADAAPALQGISAAILRDRRGHIGFIAERLTMEFADFNAMRRNLRRLRLRAMFAARLALVTARYRHLISTAGQRPATFAAENWFRFERLLEKMVPYRREALLATLMAQEHEPYANVDWSEGIR